LRLSRAMANVSDPCGGQRAHKTTRAKTRDRKIRQILVVVVSSLGGDLAEFDHHGRAQWVATRGSH